MWPSALVLGMRATAAHCICLHTFKKGKERGKRESKDEQGTPASLKPSILAEEPRLPLPFWARRPGGRLPRLFLLVEPAVDEGPDQGAARYTASEALAPQARVDSFFEAHR